MREASDDAETQQGLAEEDPDLPVDAQYYLNVWRDVTLAQMNHFVETNQFGEDLSPSALSALAFEVGCLHLYLLDHHIRGRRKDAPRLHGYVQMVAPILLSNRNLPFTEAQLSHFFGWRLGRYEDVTSSVENDSTYPSLAVQTDEYLYRIARQLGLCISADFQASNEYGLYLHVVNDEMLPDPSEDWEAHRRLDSAARSIQASLYEFTLQILTIARRWGSGDVFYEKTEEQIAEDISLGQQEATDYKDQIEKGKQEQRERLCWDKYGQEGSVFLPCDAEFVHGPYGEPYRGIRPASGEHGARPLGEWLLYAYDIGLGLHTTDIKRNVPIHLSLGKAITLLTNGQFNYFGGSGTPPDLEDPALTVRNLTKWDISLGCHHGIRTIYERADVTPSIGMVEDSGGNRAVCLFPCLDGDFLEVLPWAVPDGMMLVGEIEQRFARFPLNAEDLDHSIEAGVAPTLGGPSSSWRKRIEDEEVLFEPANRYLFGPGGMPLEVLRVASGEGNGATLRALALTCYDSNRGLLVEDPDSPNNNPDTFAFGLLLGGLTHYLRSGSLPPMDTSTNVCPIATAVPPRPVTLLDFPMSGQQDLAWTMGLYGTVPQGCMLQDTDGVPVLVVDSNQIPQNAMEAVQTRISAQIPCGMRASIMPLPPTYAYPINRSREI